MLRAAFNRNILYCKFLSFYQIFFQYLHLIETFCIVNDSLRGQEERVSIDLIGTFCIVNIQLRTCRDRNTYI